MKRRDFLGAGLGAGLGTMALGTPGNTAATERQAAGAAGQRPRPPAGEAT